ncbi:alpha/beta hydrolase [Algoriphagus machipongonensis]|uniref:Esterase n=1 Tax=Algoriphagus machipongonensis TaxID=388413 RepID=A3HWS7_9BACT|nr:alpha/beta hydrolase-fold protein [Algoriphagus machipongonensis]EAZ81050.1 esterase [Algoriphagus machipongonensis]
MYISVRKIKILSFLLIALVGIYFFWGKLTHPIGVQKVSFTPSQSENFTKGNLNFSIYRASTGVSQDVIYYFHGRNLDNTIWNDDTYYTSLIQSHWQKSKVKPPTVVSISYGPEWLLTSKNSRESSGLMDDFISNLPFIESKIGKPQNRILVGESMGGLNVLILGLNHPALFSRVAALCPGVYLDSPFSDLDKIQAAMQRTGADPKVALGIYLMAKKYVSNEEEWNEISPIELIKKANTDYPELYLSCGLYDKFGNYEGTEALAALANSKGVKTQWHPLYGGHCSIDISSLADFLIIEEELELSYDD